MRPWVALLAAVPGLCYGQVGRAVNDAVRAGVQSGKLQAEQARPTEAQGFDPENKASLPPPVTTDGRFILKNADGSEEDSDRNFAADGNVHFLYRGYEVWCDRVRGNFDTRIFTLEGSVKIQGEGQDVTAERIVVDFKDRTFRYEEGRTRIDPIKLGNRLRSPLYIRGSAVGGSESFVRTEESSLTTCDLEVNPHFELKSRSVDIIPNKRAILRGSKLQILGKTVLTIPYLVIPLNQRTDRYLPKVGQSRDEGYYILNKFSLPVKDESYLDVRTDAFSKLGFGLGGDLNYNEGDRRGIARAYRIFGQAKSQILSLAYASPFIGGDFRTDTVFQKDNYLTAPNTSTLSSRSSISQRSAAGDFRLNYNKNTSKTSSFSSENESWSLADNRRWNPKLRTDLDLNLAKNISGSASQRVQREQLDVRFRGTQDLTDAELELMFQRAIPIGTQANFFNSSDRTPMLSIRSDARRLLPTAQARDFPFRAEITWSELADNANRRYTRTSFEGSVGNTQTAKNGSSFNYNTRFKQGIYSDNTAQFVIALDGGYRYNFAPKSYLNARHTYLQPEGFTPVSIDRSGKSNQTFLELMTETPRGIKFGVQSGYDFRSTDRKTAPWQSLSLRADYQPNDIFYFRTSTTYDTNRAKWQNIRSDAGLKTSGGFLTLGTRYDAERHTWGNVNLYGEGLQFGRLKVSALLSYNGYLKQFEARHLSLIWDMHCTEAILQIIDNPTGFRRGTEIGFYIRVKAFPFETPFGVGRRGQAIGTGTGRSF